MISPWVHMAASAELINLIISHFFPLQVDKIVQYIVQCSIIVQNITHYMVIFMNTTFTYFRLVIMTEKSRQN